MKAYIVWMNTEYELAKKRLSPLTAIPFRRCKTKNRRGGRQGIPGHPWLFAGCAGYA